VVIVTLCEDGNVPNAGLNDGMVICFLRVMTHAKYVDELPIEAVAVCAPVELTLLSSKNAAK
jgi:hypothetical protein